jgi:probable O-glycosylation ligase (exosortase A-associated)
MRGLGLLLGIVGALGLTVPYPYVGVLLWSWFTLQQPHREVYGIAHSAPLNFILALVTLGAWFFSRERKTPPAGFMLWMFVIFLLWIAVSLFFAIDLELSWPNWDQIWKIFLLGFMVAAMSSSRIRIYALVWIIVISLFYYGVKGGLFTILTGGHYHVLGPETTQIADNNKLALALLMVVPLANYLRGQVADRRLSLLLRVAIGLTIVSVVGSYSRGALIGLGALGVYMLLRTRHRFVYLAMSAVLVLLIVSFMPETFFHRAATISETSDLSAGTASVDASFQARLDSWWVAWAYASDHFPLGAGFGGLTLPAIYNYYVPGHFAYVAHSIYFQVLGDLGFVGLAIYLIILAAAFFKCSRIMSVTKDAPELLWAYDLAVAIQASLFVFCVSGAGLSAAYYDLLYIELGMLLPLWQIARAAVPEGYRWTPARAALPQHAALQQSRQLKMP